MKCIMLLKRAKIGLFPRNIDKKPTDSTDKKTRKRHRHSDYFFVKSASATFVYKATPATRLIRRFPIKNIQYSNQSSLLAITVSRIPRWSVSSLGNQGHHFRKIVKLKVHVHYNTADALANELDENTNMFI